MVMKKLSFCLLLLSYNFCSGQQLLKKEYEFINPNSVTVGGEFTKVIIGYDGYYYFLGHALVGSVYDDDGMGGTILAGIDEDALVIKTDANLNNVGASNYGCFSGACCGIFGYDDFSKDVIVNPNISCVLAQSFGNEMFLNPVLTGYGIGFQNISPEGFIYDSISNTLKVFGSYEDATNIVWGAIATHSLSSPTYFQQVWAKVKVNTPSIIKTGLYIQINGNFIYGIQTGTNYVVAQLNNNQQLVWDAAYQTATSISIASMVPMSGGYLLAGTISSSDLLLHKIDSVGNTLWSKSIGLAGIIDSATCMAVKADKIFLTGLSGNDGILAAFDTSGNFLYGKKYLGAKLNSICQYDSLNVSTIILAGESNGKPMALKADLFGNAGGCNEINYSPIVTSVSLTPQFNTISLGTVYLQGGGGYSIPNLAYSDSILCTQYLEVNPQADKEIDFTVNPNPAKDEITVKSQESGVRSIEIENVVGEKVIYLKTPNSKLQTKIDVSNLTPGIYFVKVTTDRGSVVRKFVKE
jgi:hypothetical protein